MKNVFALSLIALALVACGKKEEAPAPAPAAEVVAPSADASKPADQKIEVAPTSEAAPAAAPAAK